MESPACVTPKFICNDVIARLAKWRVLATTGVCVKRQRFLDIGVTDLCGKMVLEFGKLCRLSFFCLSVYIIGHKTLRGRRAELQAACLSRAVRLFTVDLGHGRSLLQNVEKLLYYVLC